MRRLRLLLMGGFGLLIGVLAIRLIIVASGTETGADGLLMTWRDASVGQIVGPSVPVSQRTAAEQAEFWLAETDRILADAPDDAELIMGAAIVLASPTMDAIWGRNTTFEALTSGFGPIPRTDYEAIEKESRQFDERCRQRCLDLAEKATTLEPDNPIWWRLRAALQFRGSGLSQIDEPRNPNWPAVLEEAVGHDPDNALYDYLAVFTLWEAAFKVEYDASHNCLITIQDPDGFARAETHIDRAQTKSLIRGYASGMSAVDKLLARANLWSTDC
ncbi:MAG: hypothetical protein GX621_10550 [Pirellulaceae bacterium]|nr:hypothetical protein [Pirellulaceae bacterium]